jgi:large-conductance mechanosensitive channel
MSFLIRKVQAGVGDDVSFFISGRSGAEGALDWGYYVGVIVNVLFVITALATFIYLMWAAIRILSASGEKAKMEEGKQRMTFAVVGLLVAAGAYAIWNFALYVIRVTTINTMGL